MGERFVVIDLELTHPEPDDAYIVEWAAVVVVPEFFGTGGIIQQAGSLVRPPIPIPPETSAIHHIIDSDVIFAPSWEQEAGKLYAMLAEPGTIAVAHSAENDRAVLEKFGFESGNGFENVPAVPLLCTYKAALRAWPDAPRHSNEALRYWLGHGTGRGAVQAPHSAQHDALVTALILQDLLKSASVADMLKWSKEPALLPRCPIGDWRGHPWSEVDDGFLTWILRKITDREDVRFCAQHELDRREEEAWQVAAARATLAQVSAADDDIPF